MRTAIGLVATRFLSTLWPVRVGLHLLDGVAGRVDAVTIFGVCAVMIPRFFNNHHYFFHIASYKLYFFIKLIAKPLGISLDP